jgi:cyclic dehypoxanthinyl futalosine synthase
VSASSVETICDKAIAGERITPDECVALFHSTDLTRLGATAHAVRTRMHPEPVVTYIVDRNVNYSNVCITDCGFCAFYARPNDTERVWTLSREQIHDKLQELVDQGGIQVLLQGGHHPKYKLDWYEDMLRDMKANFDIHIHGFSPPEIVHFSKINKMPVREVIERLMAAGLDSIPGGGAEILTESNRREIAPKKATADEWIDVMRVAHGLGLKTSGTMMFGHVETLEDRVEHLGRIRDLQDETGGFTAFIPWTFQPGHEMADVTPVGSFEYLKTLAISRMFIDNVPNMQSSWVTQGDKIGQMALLFGANDMGSTMLEENVVSAAGCSFRMTEEQIRSLIRDLGFQPSRRNFFYEPLEDWQAALARN